MATREQHADRLRKIAEVLDCALKSVNPKDPRIEIGDYLAKLWADTLCEAADELEGRQEPEHDTKLLDLLQRDGWGHGRSRLHFFVPEDREDAYWYVDGGPEEEKTSLRKALGHLERQR